MDERGEDLDQRIEARERDNLLGAQAVLGVIEHAPIREDDSRMKLTEHGQFLVAVQFLHVQIKVTHRTDNTE